jgi:predicted DNA-binding transcriptional regulator AlpA
MSKPRLSAAVEQHFENRKRYLDADDCADRYGFSRRHWFRLVDSGRAPQPTHFGRLVRWSLESLSEWEAGGCKPVRAVSKGGAR